ncbi:MAG: D-alanyl-D-alanine carboxypeptidase, partial [Sulfobacillus sp.]|nr:D-alanyl-D-alanine carboxypeptidase [Sulfobacillus sp.]
MIGFRLRLLAVLTVVLSIGTTAHTPRAEAAAPPDIGARAAILWDPRTGAVLYEKHAFRQMDPASLTKMMTALVVIQAGDLKRVVTVSRRAAGTPGSSLHIQTGEHYTRYDLLTGLLLRSGNDASVALAESVAGSVPRFVARMNWEAARLGAFNTAFENPNGLTAPGHYSSAYDLAIIATAALKQPIFQSIVRQPEATIQELRHRHSRQIHNTNQLLYGFPGADGIKTGTTDAAGKCLAASATRNGRQLIAVVLHSPDRWGEAGRLLNWGFHNWETVEAARPRQAWGDLPVIDGTRDRVTVVVRHAVWVSVPVGERYTVRVSLPTRLTAPVKPGRVGFLTVLGPNQPPHRVGLWTTRPISAKPWYRIW